ncbi:TIR domain-containing protein [Micromonospora zamorensis]|uniref:TIR domain-containing protein n=1 Tax=Micromonospora zamorensis TaxID=709883 RepID=UPI003F4D3450
MLGLSAAGINEGVDEGLQWLRDNVNPDGGWFSEAYRNVTHGASDVSATAYAMRALASCGIPDDEKLVQSGRDWLVARQRTDGSWGIAERNERRGHIGQTGFAVSALSRAPTDHRSAEALQSALYYLYETQRLVGGWELAPGQELEPTLTAYALRGIIDASALRGHRTQPKIFLRWMQNLQQMQRRSGSWSDWFGNAESVEATGYTIELAASLGLLGKDPLNQDLWLRRALDFLATSQDTAAGGWGVSPGKAPAVWVTHSVLIALSAMLEGPADAPRLNVLANTAGPLDQTVDQYDFAISFASPQRDYARALALKLQQFGASVFFDSFEAESLWGANLIDRFTEVYREGSRLCIMIVSQEYIRRAWPRLERQSAQSRAMESDKEFILPIRVEQVDVPGLIRTVGYLDADQHDLDSIATMAMSKLRGLVR